MDGTFVINRAGDTDRLRSTKAQLDRVGLPFTRVEAVEAAEISEQSLAELVTPRLRRLVAGLPGYVRHDENGPMIYVPEHHRYLVATEIACYLSHARALDALIAAGRDAGVIFEDDVDVDADLPAVLDAARALGKGARIVKLEGVYPAHRVHIFVADVGKRAIALMLKPTAASAGYFLTRAAAQRLRERMFPIQEPYDAFLRQYWLHGIEVLEVDPFPVRQLPIPTTMPKRYTHARTLDLPASRVIALAAATPFLKMARLLRRGVALARQAPRFGRLRSSPKPAAKGSQGS